MARKIRRVVTGHDSNGVATVIMDGDADCILQRPNRPGVTLTNLWQANEAPAVMERRDDPVAGPLDVLSPRSGAMADRIEDAIAAALQLDRDDCLEHGRSFSWEASLSLYKSCNLAII